MAYEKELKFAKELALEAGEIMRTYFCTTGSKLYRRQTVLH